jgi:hypothetical protein
MAGLMTPPETALVNAAPKEKQDLYNEVVARGVMFMFDRKVMPSLVEAMREAPTPEDGIADASLMVFSRMKAAMKQANRELPGDVEFHAGAELFENLADMATAAGIKDFQKDEEALQRAFFLTLDKVRDAAVKAGDIDDAMTAEGRGVVEAVAQDGTLDQIIGQVEKSTARRGQNAVPAEEGMIRGADGLRRTEGWPVPAEEQDRGRSSRRGLL